MLEVLKVRVVIGSLLKTVLTLQYLDISDLELVDKLSAGKVDLTYGR